MRRSGEDTTNTCDSYLRLVMLIIPTSNALWNRRQHPSLIPIQPLVYLPDVGQNLQDQPLLTNQFIVSSNITFDNLSQNASSAPRVFEFFSDKESLFPTPKPELPPPTIGSSSTRRSTASFHLPNPLSSAASQAVSSPNKDA